MMNKQRKAIWDKSGGKCWYCGDDLPEKGWHADHFEPIHRKLKYDQRRGLYTTDECYHPERDNADNKVPCCASCNIQKGMLTVEKFREKIAGFVNSLNKYHTQYSIAKKYGMVQETGAEVRFWFERKEAVVAMTEQQTLDREKKIAEIREALEKATPGPWENVQLFYVGVTTEGRFYPVAECDDQNNAILIANAPEWLGFLLDELERLEAFKTKLQDVHEVEKAQLRAENEALRKALEWYTDAIWTDFEYDNGDIARQALGREANHEGNKVSRQTN